MVGALRSNEQAQPEDAVHAAGAATIATGVRQAPGAHGVWHLAEVVITALMQVRSAQHVASTLAA